MNHVDLDAVMPDGFFIFGTVRAPDLTPVARADIDIYDSVTQALYSVTLYTDATRMALSAGKQEVAAENLQELRNMAREAMMDMRLLMFELHPPVIEKEGLVTAVQARLEAV